MRSARATVGRGLLGALLIALASGCPAAPGGSGSGSAASSIAVPGELSALAIGVHIDGKPAAPIDAARIEATPPDRVDAERRVWRLRTLVGADLYSGRRATVAVETEGGARRSLVDEKDQTGSREPMLAVNAAGAVRLALIRADEPFPAFDDAAALARVTQVFIDTSVLTPADRPPVAASDLRLEVTVGAEPGRQWTHADSDRVERLPYSNDDAESREAWSLRELAKVLVGPEARVSAVDGEGRQLAIDPARWRDPEILPVVRVTRRGLVKFQWLTKSLAHVKGDAGLRGVTGLRFERP